MEVFKIVQSFPFLLNLHLKNLITVEHSVSCNHWLRWSVCAVRVNHLNIELC